jgi:hypothetical protein
MGELGMKFKIKLIEGKKSKYNRVLDILRGQDPTVNTITIMSGQNPGAQQMYEPVNKKLKGDLEDRIREMNLPKPIRIGGKFMGVFEQSVIVLNPKLREIAKLNKEFGQWGFLWGEKFTIAPGEYTMLFTMYQIDYEGDRLFFQAKGSVKTSDVLDDNQLKNVTNDFSFIPKSQQGDDPETRIGKKVNIPVFEEYKKRGIDD